MSTYCFCYQSLSSSLLAQHCTVFRIWQNLCGHMSSSSSIIRLRNNCGNKDHVTYLKQLLVILEKSIKDVHKKWPTLEPTCPHLVLPSSSSVGIWHCRFRSSFALGHPYFSLSVLRGVLRPRLGYHLELSGLTVKGEVPWNCCNTDFRSLWTEVSV